MKRRWLYPTLFLLSLNSLMATNIEIMIAYDNYLKARQYTVNEFSTLKEKLIPTRLIPFKKDGVSKIWKDEKGSYYLEFYNKVAIAFQTKDDLMNAQNVDFLRLPYTNQQNEISYISNIDKATFNQLRATSTEYPVIEQLTFFGKFYQLKDSDMILVKWNEQLRKEKYAILQSIETMIGIDWGLIELLNNKPASGKAPQKHSLPEITFEFDNGNHANPNDFKIILADALNIDLRHLDYTSQSIDIIETALMWNADLLDTYSLVLPMTSYLGEVLVKEQSLKWKRSPNGDYCILQQTNSLKTIDLLQKLQGSLVDTDFGLPEVKWVYETIIKDLKLDNG